LNNITAGVCEREDANRTRVAGHLDEIQGVVANTHAIIQSGTVGFIDWLGVCRLSHELLATIAKNLDCTPDVKIKEHKA